MAEEVHYDSIKDVEWFQNGPTTHLTENGEKSLCGVEKPNHVDTHKIEGGEFVCGACLNNAER